MNVTEHLLTCLSEEAVEVAQDCCKSLRFGLEDVNVLNPAGPNNRERLIVELNQLVAVVEVLASRGVLPVDWERPGVRFEKKAKVLEFMEYASRSGALSGYCGVKCEVCAANPAIDESISLRRVNEKGVPGIWRCQKH